MESCDYYNINHNPAKITELKMQSAKLEEILNEFYSSASTNERRRQIELDLSTLREKDLAMQYFDFMVFDIENIDNKFVWFFKISCLENAIMKEALNAHHLKITANILTVAFHNIPLTSPKLQRDKIAQLLVHLFTFNFQENDEIVFLEDILKLLNGKFLFGIVLLRTMSEEIFSTRSNVCAQKKEFLRICLVSKLQPIYAVFQRHIELLCELIFQKHQQIYDSSFKETAIEFFACIQHLISWIKLDSLVTEDFLDNLFRLATLYFTQQSETSLAALTTICELFYRQTSLPLPQKTTSNIINLLNESNLIQNDSTYLEKLTELIQLFSSQPFSKWIDAKTFKIYLDCVFNLTTNERFCGEGLEFANKVAIWKSIVKVHMAKEYGEHERLLLELVMYIFKNQLFFSKGSQAQFLDNENLDDDMLTEWQRFLAPCIEFVLLVTHREPQNLIKILLEYWNHFVDILLRLKANDEIEKTNQLNSIGGAKMIRNMSTLCQILTSVPLVLDDTYPGDIHDTLIQHFDNSTQLFCYIRSAIDTQYQNDAENLCAQYMSAVRCFIPLWEKKILTKSYSIENLLNLSLKFTLEKLYEPKLIHFEAAQLLLTISSTVRLKSVQENEMIKYFLNMSYDLELISAKILNRTSKKCRHDFVPIMLLEALCNILVLPWADVPDKEQMHEQRNYLFVSFIHKLAHDFLNVDLSTWNAEAVYKSIIKCLPIVTEILEYYREYNNAIKTKLMKAYEPIIVKAVAVLNTYINISPLAFECIIDFSKGIIATLQTQFSVASIKELLEIILSAILKIDDKCNRYKSIDKILHILMFIVERPGNISRTLFPYAIRFALDHVMPNIQYEQRVKNMDNVVVSVYSLLDCILQNKWNHFYNPQILNKSLESSSDSNDDNDELKFEEDFTNIFMAYGYGIMTWNDPEVKQIILVSMQTLNERKKLFRREFFRKNLMLQFLNAFLKTLMMAEGSLHYDQLVTILYTMGEVDKMQLRQAFIEYGYTDSSVIIGNILNAMDLPTFSENINKLVYDTKLYTNLNRNTAN